MNSLTVNAGIALNFDEVVLPHLDAAYRLARWLVGNEHDAEDVVQEACLRAFRYFRTFSGGNGRAWFLRIVRNTCYGWHSHSQPPLADVFDEEHHSGTQPTMTPEQLMLRAADAALIEQAMRDLPDRSRELLALRELEGLTYQELAQVLEIPIGTVMSGLSRARQAFRRALEKRLRRPDRHSDQAASRVPVIRNHVRGVRAAEQDRAAFVEAPRQCRGGGVREHSPGAGNVAGETEGRHDPGHQSARALLLSCEVSVD